MLTEEQIKKLGCENGDYNGPPAFPDSYRILQDPWELFQALSFIREFCTDLFSQYVFPKYLEIGLGYGGLIRAMADSDMFCYLVGVDDRRCNRFQECLVDNYGKAHYHRSWDLIEGSTRDPLVIKKIIEKGEYGVIFIDGDHSYDGVRNDIDIAMQCYAGHMKSVLILHDSIYYGPDGGVAKVVKEIERGEFSRLKVVAKFERIYGIVICEILGPPGP